MRPRAKKPDDSSKRRSKEAASGTPDEGTVRGQARFDHVPVQAIKPRASGDLSKPDPEAVLTMAESISVIGLLQPLVVDSQLRLIGGLHRLLALRLLLAGGAQERGHVWSSIMASAGGEQAAALTPEWLKRVEQLPETIAIHAAGAPAWIQGFDSKKDPAGRDGVRRSLR